MKHTFLILSTLGLVVVAAAASAQSLGDVARKEEERRKAVSSSGKVYTNDTLRADPSPAPAPPASAQPSAPAPSPSGGQDAAKPPPADDTKKDEKYWRERLRSERDALQRAQIFADALQSRINALSTDFAARDDPAQRSGITVERQKALGEMDRVKQEIQQHTKALADIQEEARRAGVPPGWAR